ncbi:MerR family transcriptional regulator [Actinoplanes sp. NPDC023936]|uniref:helix-turn-helix domain-containing protein n=1 Tax=Actinoplanes sp. NPDC023936 TaxID=3154910 RepID=UPI0034100D24
MGDLLTIGQVSRRTGLAVHTIRYWSDSGLVVPSGRSAGGYRLYDGTAVARLELIRTLRDLGFGLEAVGEVLRGRSSIADIAGVHAQALDAEIRLLEVRRSLLLALARSADAEQAQGLVDRLATVSAAHRQRLIDAFVDELAASVHPHSPERAEKLRSWLPAELPRDPTPAQVDAWVELAELVNDPEFVSITLDSPATSPADAASGIDHGPVLRPVRAAMDDGVQPVSPQARQIVDAIVGDLPRSRWRELADQVDTYTHAKAERYWTLLQILNGQPAMPPAAPLFAWFAAALRFHGQHG